MQNNRPILLVEDDQVDVLTVERAMSEVGLENPLHVAANGLEALDFLEKNPDHTPCMVLLDLNMPRMTGIEFLKELEKKRDVRKFPIIVLTTSNEERDVSLSFKHGVSGYMVKPVDYQQFVETVKRINHYWSTSLIPH